MTARLRLAGVLAALGYLAVVLLTRFGLPGAPRPLYDGFAPPPPYRWVNPPAALADLNQAPSSGSGTAAKSSRAQSLAFETSDGQASVTASFAALALTGAETGAKGELVPLDPTTYGALPAGAGFAGNVYRLTITATPSGRAITSFAAPVTMGLEIANTAGKDMYTSADGRTWTKLPTSLGQPFAFADVRAPGYFVLGGPAGLLPTLKPRAAQSSGTGGAPVALMLGGGIAVLLVGAVIVVLRRKA